MNNTNNEDSVEVAIQNLLSIEQERLETQEKEKQKKAEEEKKRKEEEELRKKQEIELKRKQEEERKRVQEENRRNEEERKKRELELEKLRVMKELELKARMLEFEKLHSIESENLIVTKSRSKLWIWITILCAGTISIFVVLFYLNSHYKQQMARNEQITRQKLLELNSSHQEELNKLIDQTKQQIEEAIQRGEKNNAAKLKQQLEELNNTRIEQQTKTRPHFPHKNKNHNPQDNNTKIKIDPNDEDPLGIGSNKIEL